MTVELVTTELLTNEAETSEATSACAKPTGSLIDADADAAQIAAGLSCPSTFGSGR